MRGNGIYRLSTTDQPDIDCNALFQIGQRVQRLNLARQLFDGAPPVFEKTAGMRGNPADFAGQKMPPLRRVTILPLGRLGSLLKASLAFSPQR